MKARAGSIVQESFVFAFHNVLAPKHLILKSLMPISICPIFFLCFVWNCFRISGFFARKGDKARTATFQILFLEGFSTRLFKFLGLGLVQTNVVYLVTFNDLLVVDSNRWLVQYVKIPYAIIRSLIISRSLYYWLFEISN